MRIVVNTRLLLPGRLEGIGWFSTQVLKRITRSNPNVHFTFLFDRAFDEQFVFADNVTPLTVSPQARHPVLYYLWLQHGVKPLLNRMKPDLFFSPDGFLALGAGCAQLPVIHDLNFLHYPGHNKWLTARYYNYYFPRFAKTATRIDTVSEYSKNDLVKNYGIDPGRIDVVYNGVNEFFKPLSPDERVSARQKFAQGNPYFIHVGSLHPRKNIPALMKGFEQFKKSHSSKHKLVLAGPGFWGLTEIRKAWEQNTVKADIIFTDRLGNQDLAQALGAATALTFVPLFEGFGIPLVEAMACEIPIITSNVSSLPEVAGNAALYVDPKSSDSIAQAMLRLLREEDLAETLIRSGRERVHEFSWDKSANLVWNSIQRTIQSSM